MSRFIQHTPSPDLHNPHGELAWAVIFSYEKRTYNTTWASERKMIVKSKVGYFDKLVAESSMKQTGQQNCEHRTLYYRKN